MKTAKVTVLCGIIFLLLSFSGCNLLGNVVSLGCSFTDNHHCYQEAAIQNADPAGCEKIAQADEFKQMNSNPPKDKCYLIIAENTNNPSVCEKIQGGLMSYQKGDCYENIAVRNENYDLCDKGSDMNTCMVKIIEKQENRIKEVLTKAGDLKNFSPEEMQKIQTEMQRLNKMTEMMSNVMKDMHEMNMGMIGNIKN